MAKDFPNYIPRNSFTVFHQTLIQIDILLYKTLFPLSTTIIQFTFIQHKAEYKICAGI